VDIITKIGVPGIPNIMILTNYSVNNIRHQYIQNRKPSKDQVRSQICDSIRHKILNQLSDYTYVHVWSTVHLNLLTY
jgi:hypothetical protein